MRRIFYIIFSFFLAVSLTGCSAILRPKINAASIILPSYSGPKARLAISDFEISTLKATSEITSGLRDMLAAALIDTNRFSVANRQSTSASIPGENADLIISVNLVEFEPLASGGRAGIGGGGGTASGTLGGLLGTPLNKARLVLDVRVVDALTSRPISATAHLKGQATDFNSLNTGSILGNWELPKSLSIYAHTPMEKAIHICIVETVRYICEDIPGRFYKY